MSKEYFVGQDSIVRQIWGRSETILFIFAGAAAEFALNKSVDWLYFTGRLPADPIGRLFSTVSYARAIVFSEKEKALHTIDAITAIHTQVEAMRGMSIPAHAYRDVLFMLIDYSIRAFETLERDLSKSEKEEVFNVFNRLGRRMGIPGLPDTFSAWEILRNHHLVHHLQYGSYTHDLFSQYQKHLGRLRYGILLEVQALIVPRTVRKLLGLRKTLIHPLLTLYKIGKPIKLDRLLKAIILPARYKVAILHLDHKPEHSSVALQPVTD